MILYNLGPNEIGECMKNRYPFLMIDRIKEAEPGKYAKGIKNFSINEWYFQGHFEDDMNVPGAIQLEAMLETFIMTFLCMPEHKGQQTADSVIQNLKFKRRIVPGDTLEIHAELTSFRRGVAKGTVTGYVDGELACSCEPTVCIPAYIIYMR